MKDNFTFEIVNNTQDEVLIPSLLIQPFIENAILHGLLHRNGEKELMVTFNTEKGMANCIIGDNGIGRVKANEINKRQKYRHESFSLNAMNERLQILSEQNNKKFDYIIEDLYSYEGVATGTKIIINFPLNTNIRISQTNSTFLKIDYTKQSKNKCTLPNMKTINAIIVDDEADAREVLASLIQLSKLPINIVSKCSNLKSAVEKIKELKPNVVFLDIQMPEFAGYEIVNFFDVINFEIVFVTAYDKYALKAFELSAIDYLVKPIKRSRLNDTLKRIVEKTDEKNTVLEYETLLESLQNKKNEKIIIPEVGQNRVILLDDIICIQGQGSYSTIYLKNELKVTVSKTLKYFEKLIYEGSSFFRSQKSWIINTLYIKQYNANQGNIDLKGGITAKISPTKIDEFKELLNSV